jgi:cytochrome c5
MEVKMNKKMLSLLIALVLGLTTLAACSTSSGSTPTVISKPPVVETQPSTTTELSPTDASQPTQAIAIDGKTLLETRCAGCHSITRITNKSATAADWKITVERMMSKGAQLTPEEEAILIQYLADNFK